MVEFRRVIVGLGAVAYVGAVVAIDHTIKSYNKNPMTPAISAYESVASTAAADVANSFRLHHTPE